MKRKASLLACALLAGASTIHASSLEVDQGRSRIQVDAKATGHHFTCTLKKFNARISGDAGTLKPEECSIDWSFKDLDSNDAKRDKEMIHWLGEAEPGGSFTFIKSWTDQSGKSHAMGKLTIHGVSKTISFPFSTRRDGQWVAIDGSAAMDYQDFKLPIIRAMAVMTVDPKLAVRFHLVGKVK